MGSKVSFITNTEETHREFLTNCLNQADKVLIAVGFLKQSGLNNIINEIEIFCSRKAKASKFYVGIGLGETDPDALLKLHNIIKNKAQHQLLLCTPDAGIFHPKVYVFITGRKAIIVTGSSNLTHHGWEVNDEVSMITETTIHSPEFAQLNQYFYGLEQKYLTENVEQLIHKYKKELLEHLSEFGAPRPFRFRNKKEAIPDIDLPRLKAYYRIYQDSEYYIHPKDREKQYQQAKQHLEVLASYDALTEKQFHLHFGSLVGHKQYRPKLWHSGSIHRTTYKTLDYPDSFREVVRAVKENLTISVDVAFNNVTRLLKKMRANNLIHGVGVNIVTEIFLSYDSKKFANLNKNPIAVLSLLGKDYSMSAFKGDDYKGYIDLLLKIRRELDMSTFLEIDSFFNYVYWNLLEDY